MMINFNNITKSINEKGFHLCENFLKIEDIENLKKLLFYKAEKNSDAAVISFNKKKYLIVLVKIGIDMKILLKKNILGEIRITYYRYLKHYLITYIQQNLLLF